MKNCLLKKRTRSEHKILRTPETTSQHYVFVRKQDVSNLGLYFKKKKLPLLTGNWMVFSSRRFSRAMKLEKDGTLWTNVTDSSKRAKTDFTVASLIAPLRPYKLSSNLDTVVRDPGNRASSDVLELLSSELEVFDELPFNLVSKSSPKSTKSGKLHS